MKMASYWVQRMLILLMSILQVKAQDQCQIYLMPNGKVLCNFPTALCSLSPKQGYEITIYTEDQQSSKSMLRCRCKEGQPECSPKNGYEFSTAGGNLTLNIYPCDDGTYLCEGVATIEQEGSRCTLELTTEDVQASMRELVPSTTSTAPTTSSTTPTQQDARSESNTGSLEAAIVCGIVNAVLIAALIFSHRYVHKKHQQKEDQQTEKLKEKNQRIRNLGDELQQKYQRIQNLDDELQKKNQRIQKLENELQQKNQRIWVLEDEQNTNTDISNGQRQDLPVPGVGAALRPASPAAVRPASQTDSRPASQTAPRPASQTAPRPASQTAPRPASQTAPRPASQTAPRPASQTAPCPASQTALRPASETASAAASSPVVPSSTSSKPSTICTQNTAPGMYVLGDQAVQYNIHEHLALGSSQFDGYSVGVATVSSSIPELNSPENGPTEHDADIMQGDDAPRDTDPFIPNVKPRENSEKADSQGVRN